MSSFFNKLNTLVQAHLNDLVRPLGSADEEQERRQALSRRDIRKGLDGDLKTLKKRVDEALQHENKLQGRVDKLYAEIADWDAKADDYLRQGNEAQARYALGQLRRAQQDLESAESALREHHIVTQELVQQVTQLEAVLDDARQREEALANAPASAPVAEDAPPVRAARPAPEDRLRKPAESASEPPPAPKAETRIKVKVEQDDDSDQASSTAVPVERKLPPNIQVAVSAPAPLSTSQPSAPAPSEAPSPVLPAKDSPEIDQTRPETTERRVKTDPNVTKGETLARQIADKLDQTREKLGSLTAQYEQYVAEDKPKVLDEVNREVRGAEVEDDLARRRARLAKPEDDKP